MQHLASIARAMVLTVAFVLLAGASSAADETRNLLRNPDISQGKNDQPSIWFAAQVPAEGLRMWRSSDNAHSAGFCLAIANEHEYPQTVCNNWAQNVQEVPVGKTIHLTAWLRTEDADAVNVCVQCWAVDSKTMLAFTSTPVVRGTSEWTQLSSDPIVVPAGTASIIVRASLAGKGKAFFDDLALSVIPVASAASASSPATVSLSAGAASMPIAPAPAPASLERTDLGKAVPGRILRALPLQKDCMVLSYMPDWAWGTIDNVGVANNDGGVRMLVDWPAVPPEEADRPNVKFILALYSRKTTLGDRPSAIQVYPIQANWEECTSWRTQPRVASEPSVTFPFLAEKGWKLFDITGIVRAQAKRPEDSHGLLLRFAEENRTAGQKSDWSGYAFVSREGLGEWEGFRPLVLVVESTK